MKIVSLSFSFMAILILKVAIDLFSTKITSHQVLRIIYLALGSFEIILGITSISSS